MSKNDEKMRDITPSMMAVRKIYQKRKVAHNQPFITSAKTTCVERIGYLDNELITPPQPKETVAARHGADKNANQQRPPENSKTFL